MKLFGPRGVTVVNLPVQHGENRIQAPVAFAYRLLRLGFAHNFRYKDLVGADITVPEPASNVTHLFKVTRTHLVNLREGLEQVGVLELYGQGIPARIMTFGPVLPILIEGQHDWKNWTLPHDPDETVGPYRPIVVNYSRKFEGVLVQPSRMRVNTPRKRD